MHLKLIQKLKDTNPYVDLYYVDYRDELTDPEHIHSYIKEWYIEWIEDLWDVSESVRYILEEVYTEEEIQYIRENDDLRFEIEDWIYSNDKSDPTSTLAKQTKTWFRYDLDIEIPDMDYYSSKEYNSLIKKITNRFKKFWYKEKHIRNMIGNASYWWQLYMLWYWDLSDFRDNQNKKYTEITWELICFNSDNWSWRGTEQHETIKVQWNPDNLILDDLDTWYWYATDLCGLCPSYYDWCVGFTDEPKWHIRISQVSLAKEKIEEQRKFDKIYREWWCSASDRNMSRHRNVKYRNDYPCGWKCENCWRFWID